ncbi:hypothetical protein O6H91_05G026500 [Diphasiastrum complanatum]|uniref:Uncharacterized protein n=1 Tax=Diphasiastrum complanatum TaxID=34168 RepID=A0ACC2DLM0_DIPCM|nr:hypothetical protein O6H91_05G026500 [Diphasiastrum complanatum]
MSSTRSATRMSNCSLFSHQSLALALLLVLLSGSYTFTESAVQSSSTRKLAAAETKYHLSIANAVQHPILAPLTIRTFRNFGTLEQKNVNRRVKLQQDNTTSSSSQNQRPIQVRNDRIDPLKGFKKYRGGYDLKSKHYWASLVFTGISGFAIGAALLLVGLVWALLLLIFCCARKFTTKRKFDEGPRVVSSWIFLALIVFLIIVAIVFCGVGLYGSKRVRYEFKKVESTIVDSANNATATIYNVTSTITEIEQILLPYDQGSSFSFNSTIEKLNSEASNVHHKVYKNKRRIDPIIRIVYIVLLVITSVTILILVIAFVCTLLHRKRQFWRRLFNLSLIVCWILTIVSWFIFGGFYAVHNFVDDTCIALVEYQSDPYNSTLNNVLPCLDLKTTNDAVIQVRGGMHDFISQANYNISLLQQAFSNNKNITSLPHICNPFSGPPDYKQDVKCAKDTVPIGDVPNVLQPLKCSGNDTQECISSEGKYITDAQFDTIFAFASAAQSLLDITPSLESLSNCSFVENAFSIIVNERCSPTKSAVHTMWAAYVGLGTSAVLLLIVSIIELYITRKAHSYVRGIVDPHNTSPPLSNVGDVYKV